MRVVRKLFYPHIKASCIWIQRHLMQKPNFFLVGAPKCGTTSLYSFLRLHPDVFLSTPKELNYFHVDFPGLVQITSEEEYLSQFTAANGKKIVGESTPLYLTSSVAAERIKQFNPNARLVCIFRNPIDFAISWYSHMRRYGTDEDQQTFRAAWDLQEDRANGKNIPLNAREPAVLQYRNLATFGKQLQRLLAHFPREQVLIFLLEDLVNDFPSAYAELRDFLDIEDDGRRELGWSNRGMLPRQSLSRSLMQFGFPLFRACSRGLIAASRVVVSESFAKRVQNRSEVSWNRVYRRFALKEGKPVVTAEDREIVRLSLLEDMKLLEELVGKDLRSWYEPS